MHLTKEQIKENKRLKIMKWLFGKNKKAKNYVEQEISFHADFIENEGWTEEMVNEEATYKAEEAIGSLDYEDAKKLKKEIKAGKYYG